MRIELKKVHTITRLIIYDDDSTYIGTVNVEGLNDGRSENATVSFHDVDGKLLTGELWESARKAFLAYCGKYKKINPGTYKTKRYNKPVRIWRWS